MKNRFLSEQETVKRAALIFLLSKIFFTDEFANKIQLRISALEWEVFTSYIDMSKQNSQYLPIFIIINHLLSCNFFKFTVKNKQLALESGAPEVDSNYQVDLMRDRMFWDDLNRQIEILEKCKIVELKQLESIHDEMMKPFREFIPESNDLKDALEIFNDVKKNISEAQSQPDPLPNLSKKEALAVCDTFIKSQNLSKIKPTRTKYNYDEDMSESDDVISDFEIPSTSKKSKRKNNKTRGRKSNKKTQETKTRKENSTSDSDSDTNNLELRKVMSSNHQSVINGISVEKYSQRLKECYKND